MVQRVKAGIGRVDLLALAGMHVDHALFNCTAWVYIVGDPQWLKERSTKSSDRRQISPRNRKQLASHVLHRIMC